MATLEELIAGIAEIIEEVTGIQCPESLISVAVVADAGEDLVGTRKG